MAEPRRDPEALAVTLRATRRAYSRELARTIDSKRNRDELQSGADTKDFIRSELVEFKKTLVADCLRKGIRIEQPTDGKQGALL